MKLTLEELHREVMSSENEEKAVYVYSLKTDQNEPLNFNLANTRKILPTKVLAKMVNGRLIFYKMKGTRVFKGTIDYAPSYKPSLEIFTTSEECITEYNEILVEAKQHLNELINNCKNFIDELELASNSILV